MPLDFESPRPTASQELYDHLQSSYGIDLIGEPKHLGGSRNLNLLLTTTSRKCVARVYRAWVSTHRLRAIQSARTALLAGGVPSPVVEPTLFGEQWTSRNDCLIEVEEYVEHDANLDTWERLAIGLPLLGLTHNILTTVKVESQGKQPMIANHIGSEEVVEVTAQGIDRIRSWPPDPMQSRFAAAAESLARRLRDAEQPFVGKLPIQLVHGDFWDNNVFFRAGRVVLVTDLDFMGERPRVDDLALTLYYTNSTFADDPLSEVRIRRLKTLVDAYDSGLAEPLSVLERRALPLAIARTPLFMLRYISLMENRETAARPIAETLPDLEWGLKLLDNLAAWQEIFVASESA
jgi:Ser/Thr protein kinase RdoA (MazF antagonist)